MGDFQQSVAQTRRYEGGNSDNPADPGGRTSRGVTQRSFDAYNDRHGFSRSDVFTASDATINQVYFEDYWQQFFGDELANGTAFCIFDAAVNSGLAQATKWVQRSLGIEADGDFGSLTRDSVKACSDQNKLVSDICARRLAMMRALPTWKTFGNGWTARVNNVQMTATAWNSALPGLPASMPETATPKADVTHIKPPVDQSAPTTAVTVGGLGAVIASISTLGDTAKDAADQLSPLGATWPRIAEVCAALTLISVVIGLYISFRQRQHAAIVSGAAK